MLALLCALAPLATPPPQLADRLEAARGYGQPGTVTGTPDGSVILSAEGASLALIAPRGTGPGSPGQGAQGNGAPDPDVAFDHPLAQFELGRSQPHAVRMRVDPEADPLDGSTLIADGEDYRNFAYIAAGSNGLWIVDLDPFSGGVHRVARVDDSGDVPGVQDSSRHCNDVEFVTLDGRDFLVATFAARDDNLLRVYPLEEVRSVLLASQPSGDETGFELAPALELALGAYGAGDPGLGYTPGPAQLEGSYASDLVVQAGSPSSDAAFAFVAMRCDGLVRVRLDIDDIDDGVPSPGAVAWGPRFGDGSHYATVAPPAPFPDERSLYDNVQWINQQTDPDVVERSDPPYFSFVTAYEGKLYVGVDALGFVVFDISDPGTWGPTMPIDHHEAEAIELQGGPGLSNPGAWPERVGAVAASATAASVSEILGYVRGMEVAKRGPRERLVVTYTGAPSIGNAPLYLEGFAYDDRFQYGGVTYWEQMVGPRTGQTRVFDLDDFPEESPTPTLTDNILLQVGGSTLFVPSDQSNQMAATPVGQRIEFVHNVFSTTEPEIPGTIVERPTICMMSIRIQGSSVDPVVAIRDREFLAGRRTFGLQQSPLDADLIMTSDNDGHPREGVPYLLGAPGSRAIEVDYDPTAPGGNDTRLTTGVIMGRKSQWLDPRLGPQQQAQLGASAITHRVSVQTIPDDFLGTPPIAEYHVQLLPLPDRWNAVGRGFYLGGMVDLRYDDWVRANVPGLGDAEYFFLFRQNSPDGVVYGRRDALMDLVTSGSIPNNGFLPPAVLNGAGGELRLLNTHPEFDEFPFSPSQPGYAAAQFWYRQFVNPQPYSQRVKTWEPELVQVRAAPGSPYDVGWVLAVPSGVSVLNTEEPPDLADVTTTPNTYTYLDDVVVGSSTGTSAWLPDPGSPEAEAFDHGLVMLWDFTDPSAVPSAPGKPPGSSTLGRIVVPIASEETPADDVGRSSFAWHLETVEVERGGLDHSFVIVGDFVGGVHAYSISDVLAGADPLLEDSWYPPLGLQDRLTNNVRDVVLDRTGTAVYAYVAVQRVGVVVLELVVDSAGALTFEQVALLDDCTEPLTLHVRVVDGTGERLLYVSDSRQALRVYSSL